MEVCLRFLHVERGVMVCTGEESSAHQRVETAVRVAAGDVDPLLTISPANGDAMDGVLALHSPVSRQRQRFDSEQPDEADPSDRFAPTVTGVNGSGRMLRIASTSIR